MEVRTRKEKENARKRRDENYFFTDEGVSRLVEKGHRSKMDGRLEG